MGRKNTRLVKAREPNGRIQREQDYSPAHIRRIRDLAIRGFADQIWGTELGRLFMEKAITGEMLEAGRRWARDADAYRKAIGIFPVRGVTMERGKSTPPDPDSPEGKIIDQRAREAAEAFFAAHSVLSGAGIGAEDAVRRLCEDDEAVCGQADFARLRLGLTRLAAHYGLTDKAKSEQTVK